MIYKTAILFTDNRETKTKTFDRYSRAEQWAKKQLIALDSVYNTAVITKCGDSTGWNENEIAVIGCDRNFNGMIVVQGV